MSHASGLTRRRLIGTGTAVATGAAVLPGGEAAAAPKRRRTRRADVIVVGAGFSGLQAALDVAARGKSVLVLEARNRVGGRVKNARLPGGGPIEIGGQWVGPTQDRLLGTARDLGVDTFPSFDDGDGLLVYEGRKQTFATDGPFGPIPPVADGVADAALAIAQLDEMAKEVPVAAPWTAARAGEWDSQTFETWKQANTTTKGGRFLVDLGFKSVFAAEPRDVSLLFSLFYMAAAGNESTPGSFTRLISTAGGAQESRFVGGSHLVARRMADRLGRKRIVLRAPVRRIAQARGGVEVVTDRGTFAGRQVIVALPPALCAGIDFSPKLPSLRAQLQQRMPMGTVVKCLAVYEKPFWRDEGLAGYTNADTDPVGLTFDNSPPDGSLGVLLGFIEGTQGRFWSGRPRADRRAAVLDNFATFYGERARSPIAYLDKAWSEDVWSRGCYEGYTAPGVLLDYGSALRAPVGRVKWAGTETAEYWTGYIEGAMRAGTRAAAEALADA